VRASGGVSLNVTSGALRIEPHPTSPNLISGHSGNYVTADVYGATIGGGGASGGANRVTANYATVGGGLGNTASFTYTTIGGGIGNTASFTAATVGGGWDNEAGGPWATVGGGLDNKASGNKATVSGGAHNETSGWGAIVPGGRYNTAEEDCSFAAGFRAKAKHDGAFVWADFQKFDFDSTANNQFSARTTGGARFVSAIDSSGNPTAGVVLAPGGTSWGWPSSRAIKENFASADAEEILEQLASLPVEIWNLRSQDPSIRHIGPVAEDFYAAFGFGEDNRHINAGDADGVALAAVQGLYELSQEQAARIEALEAENAALRSQMADLQQRVEVLEQRSGLSRQAEVGLLSEGWLGLGGLLAGLGLVWFNRRGRSS